MEIHIFQSNEGDCLMIEDQAGEHRILCDGGTESAMRSRIAVELNRWAQEEKAIDLVYVSHIDADHIGGVFAMLDAAAQWKVYDILLAQGDPPKEPELPRPPRVQGIWHNAFRDLVTKNTGKIEEALAASAPLLQSSQVQELVHLGHEYAQIATSIPQALKVSRLIKPDMLDIELNVLPQNPEYSGKLLQARDGQNDEQIGSLTISILCPTDSELKNLRTGWNTWLRDSANKKKLQEARAYYADGLDTADPFADGNPLDLYSWNGIAAYKEVTAPNVASTVLMVEEAGKRVLLTGDNHPDMILAGLEYGSYLDDECIHLDVLKYPHHGSDHNITPEFTLAISADHYVFCGDGSNDNPELSVLRQVFASRIGPASQRARSPEAIGRPFTFWFSTSPGACPPGKQRTHMEKVLAWAEEMQSSHPEFSARFSSEGYLSLLV